MSSTRSQTALPPWSKLNWGDYAKATSFLDGELHGAYLNLLRVYLSDCGPLQNNEEQIFLRAGIKTDAMREATRVVLRVLFSLDDVDGLLHNKLADKLIAIGTNYSEEQSQKARTGMEGRERDERGRIMARRSPALAGERPALGGNTPSVAGDEPAVAGSCPAILEVRTKNKEQRIENIEKELEEYISTNLPESFSEEGSGNNSMAAVAPAPPKGTGEVGADMSVHQPSPTILQPQDDSPPPSAASAHPDTELSAVEQERLANRQKNDALFAEMPLWMQQHIVANPHLCDGGLLLTPQERESLECRLAAALLDGKREEEQEESEAQAALETNVRNEKWWEAA